MSTTLFVPTLNEIVGMREVMPRVRREWVDQILVADANSPDGTAEYARQQGYDVVIQRKPGIRHAYIEAMPLVRGDVVITFSPDGNCVPELIPRLLEEMERGYDMVIVSRYLGPARSADDTPTTRFGNWFFTTSINLLHGGHYTDSMGIFRAWRRELFYELDLHKDEAYATEKLLHTVIGCEPLLSVRAAKRKLRVTEIPGPEPERVGGERKLQVIRWGGAYALQVLREKFYWK